MTDSYFLPARKARICRWAGTLFLIASAYWGIGMVVGAVAPGLRFACEIPKPCVTTVDPVLLLTVDEQTAISRQPAVRARVDAWVARPLVRLGLGAIGVLDGGAVVVLLLAVGLALRRLGARGRHVLARAIPWLKYASWAGIAWAVLGMLVPGLRSLLLAPATENVLFPINLGDASLPLLLAVAAYVTAWALEAGIRAERDLADFV